MAWVEFFMNKSITTGEIKDTMSRYLNVKKAAVNVILGDETEWWPDNDEVAITIVLRRISGEFTTRIDLIVLDIDVVKNKSPLEVIGAVCRDLGCFALSTYGEDSLNPYAWVMTRNEETHYRVFVDQDMLDSQNMELRIVKVGDQIE